MAKILDPDLLTFIVNGSPTSENVVIDTTGKTIRLVAGGSLIAKDGVTGQCLFSKLKEMMNLLNEGLTKSDFVSSFLSLLNSPLQLNTFLRPFFQ